VEPSPANLFYLTSTIHALAKQWPDVAHRVEVLPIAASNETGSNTLYAAAHNAGNSVVGASSPAVRDHEKQDMTSEQYAINTRCLDDVDAIKRLLGAGGAVPLVKLDVQGFECRAIDGMLKLLQRANTLRVELADRWLRAHGCSPSEALLKMERLGFAVNAPTPTTTNAPPPCILRSRSGCDIAVRKPVSRRSVPVAGNLCRWRWSGDALAGQFCPASWCAACASNPVCRAQCRLREHQWYGLG
jgi:FkbM family methyltransferase